MTVDHLISLNGCDGPAPLALDNANRRLFSGCGNNVMVVTNADSGKVLASVPIGGDPQTESSTMEVPSASSLPTATGVGRSSSRLVLINIALNRLSRSTNMQKLSLSIRKRTVLSHQQLTSFGRHRSLERSISECETGYVSPSGRVSILNEGKRSGAGSCRRGQAE